MNHFGFEPHRHIATGEKVKIKVSGIEKEYYLAYCGTDSLRNVVVWEDAIDYIPPRHVCKECLRKMQE